MKNERLDWLADNPLYTKRFAFYVGRRCREATIKEIADELFLDWHSVKELEKQYMREQLLQAGSPGPRVIGIDEISIGKGHRYRIVVTDLIRGRAIWFGGKDRSEESMDEFFRWLGTEKSGKIRLAVMDMWKAYLLKESFGQLWDYHSPTWARKFFDQWCHALRWQRLKPFQKFARMVEAHWDGIEAYCHEENKVPLGFVEGFNNKIRVIQRRAYGLRDEEYLRLKILTCMLPKL